MIPVQQLLPASLALLLKQAPLSPEKVQFAWRTAVGAAVDRATTVTLGADGVLHVIARNRTWKYEIGRADATTLARLQSLLGADVVRRIETRVSPQ